MSGHRSPLAYRTRFDKAFPMLHVASSCLYLVGTAMLVTFGLRYAFASKAMPYHLVAMGKSWAEVDQGTKAILIALMRCAGAAYLAVSVASVWIVLAAQVNRASWANPALVSIYTILLLPLTLAMQQVRLNTQARPPINASIIGLSMVGLACACDWL